MFPHNDVLFQSLFATALQLGVKCLQNPILGGVNRCFQDKCAKYSNCHFIKNYCSSSNQICTVIKTLKYSSHVVPKYKMADGHYLERKMKSHYISVTVWLIFTICTSYDVFPCQDVPFRGLVDTATHLPMCPQNTHFGDVNSHTFVLSKLLEWFQPTFAQW